MVNYQDPQGQSDQNPLYEPPTEPTNPQTAFLNQVTDAFVYFFFQLVYLLFICPFGFWREAAVRLSRLRGTNGFTMMDKNSPWPFLTFLKKVLFDFAFDGTIFISYFVGIVAAIYCFFRFTVIGVYGYHSFVQFWVCLVFAYYYPLSVSYVRDLCTLLLLPIRKLLSWLRKPAQDLTIHMDPGKAK